MASHRHLLACALSLPLAASVAAGGQSVFVSEPTHIRNGWSTFPLLTRGESIPLIGGTAGQMFSWTEQHRQWDGLGAFLADPQTLQVYINHEMSPGGAISRLHLGRDELRQWIAGRVIGNTNTNQTPRPAGLVRGLAAAWAPSDTELVDRPCSGSLWEPHTFGYERGFHDRLYLSGEETFALSGHIQVIDPASNTRHEAADVGGGGSWESATLLDTGRTDTIALLLGEDQGDSPLGTAPLSLYVGRKNPAGSFLERNGLVGGTTYYWDADGTDTTIGSLFGSLFSGGNGARAIGTWTTDRTEAVLFSKAEDVHADMQPTSVGFGTRAALASQGQAVFLIDFGQLDFVAGDLGPSRRSDVSVLFAAGTDRGDGSGATGLFDSMDNLVWSADGNLYVNEDDGEGDIWEIRVADLLADQAAGVLAPRAELVFQILDADAIGTLGINESSGIIDISSLVGYVPGSVFLTNGMGNVADQLAMLVAPTATPAPLTTTIDVPAGTRTQRQAGQPILSGTPSVVKAGGGTLVLDQVNTLTGSFTTLAGTTEIRHSRALQTASLTTLAGGTTVLAAGVMVDVAGFDPQAGGLLDVGTGLLRVADGLEAADVVAAIVAGRGTGGWNGVTGITSSGAAATAHKRAVGWRTDADGSSIIAFAAPGDTNLDWTVDLLDATDMVGGGGFDTGHSASWRDGDFNYDGVTDILDVAAFMGTGLYDAGGYNQPAAEASGIAVVPEPAAATSLGIVAGLATITIASRRRLALRHESRTRSGRLRSAFDPSAAAASGESDVRPVR